MGRVRGPNSQTTVYEEFTIIDYKSFVSDALELASEHSIRFYDEEPGKLKMTLKVEKQWK